MFNGFAFAFRHHRFNLGFLIAEAQLVSPQFVPGIDVETVQSGGMCKRRCPNSRGRSRMNCVSDQKCMMESAVVQREKIQCVLSAAREDIEGVGTESCASDWLELPESQRT